MGRKLDALLNRGFRAPKCLTLLKLTIARIKLVRNKKTIAATKSRKEIAHLLQTGKDSHVYIMKAASLVREENFVVAYDLIDQFCQLVINRLPLIEAQRECPLDIKEAVSSLIFAAPRCSDLVELMHVRDMFTAKYGKDFSVAAAELRPDCGVNREIIEKLSTRPPTGQMKLKVMKEIAVANNIEWTEREFANPAEDLLDGSSQLLKANEVSQADSKQVENKKPVEGEDSNVDTVIPASSTVDAFSELANSVTPAATSAKENLSQSFKSDTPQHDEPATSDILDAQEAVESKVGLDDDSVEIPRSSDLIADDEEATDSEPDPDDEGEIHAEIPAAASTSNDASKPASEEALRTASSFGRVSSSNASEKPLITVTSFDSGRRREYKDFASAAQAAFESAALAAEAAQAAIDLAKFYAEPASSRRVASLNHRDDESSLNAGVQTTPGGRTGSGFNKNVLGMDSDYHLDRPHETGENEDSSDSDDGVGGIESSKWDAVEQVNKEERSPPKPFANASSNRRPSRLSEARAELETNPVSLWNQRGAAKEEELMETSKKESVEAGGPRFDDESDDSDEGIGGHFASYQHAAEARFAERDKQRIRVPRRKGPSPFVEEGDEDHGSKTSFGWKLDVMESRKEVLRYADHKLPQFDEPQFDEVEEVEVRREREEAQMKDRYNYGWRSSDERKLRWNSSTDQETAQRKTNSRYGESRRSTKVVALQPEAMASQPAAVAEIDGLHKVDVKKTTAAVDVKKATAEVDGKKPAKVAELDGLNKVTTEVDGKKERPWEEIKTSGPPPPRRPPPPPSASQTPPPPPSSVTLAASVSDPVILASSKPPSRPRPVSVVASAAAPPPPAAKTPPPPVAKLVSATSAPPLPAVSSPRDPHVHPKLPDYDDLAAHFEALRKAARRSAAPP